MKQYFENISKINYEGPLSTNPFSFKYYNPDEVINGKTMKEHLRFTLSYWHTLCGTGGDPFGDATMQRAWSDITDPIELAKAKVDACFEIMEKLNIDYFAFHDRDISPEGKTLAETNAMLDEVVDYIENVCKKLERNYCGEQHVCLNIHALCMEQLHHAKQMFCICCSTS